MNYQDKEGQTALHKIALNERLYSTYIWIIKEMITRGGIRNIEDNVVTTPLQLVDCGDHIIKLFWEPEMNKPGCQLKTPVIHLRKSWNIFVINFSLMLPTFILSHWFVFPYEEYYGQVFHIDVFFKTAKVLFFLISSKVPGFMIQHNNEIKLYNLVQAFQDISKWNARMLVNTHQENLGPLKDNSDGGIHSPAGSM